MESLPGQYICAGFNGHGGSTWSPPMMLEMR
jgi:hypothetical protein